MQNSVITENTAAFEDAAPQEILAWAVRTFGHRLAVACSFGGLSGAVLVDMVAKIDANVSIFYLDTGLLFAETHDLIARVRARYGIVPVRVASKLSLEYQADTYGTELWERLPDLCCRLRKVEPTGDFLRGYAAWVTGVRRDQSSGRQSAPIVSRDRKFGLIKINALANWTEEMLWAYVRAHDVPYNALLDSGYRSIGCTVCTDRVSDGEEERAGRWRRFAKTECGLHG